VYDYGEINTSHHPRIEYRPGYILRKEKIKMRNVLMVLWGAATASGWWACVWWGFGNPFMVMGTVALTSMMVATVIVEGIKEIIE
jgi:hypothetical protein